MTTSIRWGIIGIGKIAEKFAFDLQTVENAQLIAVASTNLERAETFAQKFDVKHAFGRYEDIFSIENLDVIYIATPHTLHAECTKLCLNNGVAVLCEKPFAMNEQQVSEMIELATEKQLFLMEAMWTRFLPSTKKVIELIEANEIGEIKSIHADFGFKAPFAPERRLYNPKLGGGALLDIGIYPAYLSLLLLGYPSSIQATSNFSTTGIDETTSFLLRYDSQAMAVLNCTITANTRSEAFIYGTKGYIHISSRFHESKGVTLYKENENPINFSFERQTRGYDYEIREVNQCLLENKIESSLMPLHTSRKLIHLLDKIREKAGIKYSEGNSEMSE
jgi:predicted dehydrogenase